MMSAMLLFLLGVLVRARDAAPLKVSTPQTGHLGRFLVSWHVSAKNRTGTLIHSVGFTLNCIALSSFFFLATGAHVLHRYEKRSLLFSTSKKKN